VKLTRREALLGALGALFVRRPQLTASTVVSAETLCPFTLVAHPFMREGEVFILNGTAFVGRSVARIVGLRR